MMDFLKNYIINIVTISIVLILVEIITPSNKIKKFVSLVAGFVLIIAIIKPAVGILDKDFSFKNVQVFNSKFLVQKEAEYDNKLWAQKQNKTILEVYKQKIYECIKRAVKDIDNSLEATSEITVNEDAELKDFGDIKKISINIIKNKKHEEGDDSGVKVVDIKKEYVERNDESKFEKNIETKLKEKVSGILGVAEKDIVVTWKQGVTQSR